MKKWIIAIVVIAAVAVIYFTYNPAESEYFPKCPFYELTGLKCPGCGSQRAIHQLLNGNVANAFAVHPLLVLAIPYLLVTVYFEYMGGKKRYPVMRKRLFGTKACMVILITLLFLHIGY